MKKVMQFAMASAVVFGAASAQAQITVGSRLNFAGSVDVIEAGAAGVSLDFDPQTVLSTGNNLGSFSTIAFGTTGVMKDFTAGTGPLLLPSVLTIGGFTFNLTSVQQGSFGQALCAAPPASGQTCTPLQAPGVTVSPFNLSNSTNDSGIGGPLSSDVAFSINGTVFRNSDPGNVFTFTGRFTTQFVGQSYQEILAILESGSGTLPDVSFSATFITGNSVVPEPSTYALMATGIGALGLMSWRRRRPTV